MFPLGLGIYVKAALVVSVFLAGLLIGYNHEHTKLVDFEARVQAAGEAQKLHIEQIKKEHELVTKGIQDEYDAKIAALRNYYKSTSVWNNTSSSPMPKSAFAPSATDAITAYNQLVGSCAETTQQLVSLQKWINEQVGIQ